MKSYLIFMKYFSIEIIRFISCFILIFVIIPATIIIGIATAFVAIGYVSSSMSESMHETLFLYGKYALFILFAILALDFFRRFIKVASEEAKINMEAAQREIKT